MFGSKSKPSESQLSDLEALQSDHWYRRLSEGGRSFFWSLYFLIFVVSAVTGLTIHLFQKILDPGIVSLNPTYSIAILITGAVGEMWCFHRCYNIHLLKKPGAYVAKWGVWVSLTSLMVILLLSISIVYLYLTQ